MVWNMLNVFLYIFIDHINHFVLSIIPFNIGKTLYNSLKHIYLSMFFSQKHTSRHLAFDFNKYPNLDFFSISLLEAIPFHHQQELYFFLKQNNFTLIM